MNATKRSLAPTVNEQTKNTMTSREIAEIAGKRHTEVLRSIKTMEPAWEKVTERKFALSEYVDSSGKKNPEYELTRDECLYVSTKFNDEARAKVIIRWSELERKVQTNPLLIDQNAGVYPEKTVITVKMGNLSNQIYVIDGAIYAKLAPISRMMGYDSTPTHLLNRWGDNNRLKVKIGHQEPWFINVVAFSEWVKVSNRVPYGIIATIYKDVFNIDRKKDEDNPYTYFFTDAEMNEILFSLFKKPVNKDYVVELLTNGKINNVK